MLVSFALTILKRKHIIKTLGNFKKMVLSSLLRTIIMELGLLKKT
jgi:hypothetical protein